MSLARIDAHQHFWRLDARRGSWPPASLAAIHRDFAPDDLRPALAAACVAGTVAVQSLPSLDDTRFLLDLAERETMILGVVGWADLKAPDAAVTIATLARHRALRGLRPMLQDLPERDWIDDPALDPAVDAMRMASLGFDALVRPEHLPALLRFAQRHPDLPIVIDHGAKPNIAEGLSAGWRDDLARLAERPQVEVKLSGLFTEADAAADKAEAVRPFVETLLALFGPERVIWGSDWPVLLLAEDYAAWAQCCEALVPASAHEAVFSANAQRFYRLPPVQPSDRSR